MLYAFLPTTLRTHFLIEQTSFVTIFAISGFIILAVLLFGVRKYFNLKAENNESNRPYNLQSKDDNKVYKNFTEGHLYDSY